MVAERKTRDLLKDVGKGLLVSLVAGYCFITLFGLPYLMTSPNISALREVLVTVPLIASFFTLWWLPLVGAFLGFALPRWAARWNRREALRKGARAGLAIGAIGGVLIGLALLNTEPGPLWAAYRREPETFWIPMLVLGVPIGVYSAIWVAIFARHYAGKTG